VPRRASAQTADRTLESSQVKSWRHLLRWPSHPAATHERTKGSVRKGGFKQAAGALWLSPQWLSPLWLSPQWLSPQWLSPQWLSPQWLSPQWLVLSLVLMSTRPEAAARDDGSRHYKRLPWWGLCAWSMGYPCCLPSARRLPMCTWHVIGMCGRPRRMMTLVVGVCDDWRRRRDLRRGERLCVAQFSSGSSSPLRTGLS